MDDRIDELYASVVDTGRRTPRSGGGSSSGRGRVAVALVAVLAVCAVVGWLVLRPGSTPAGTASETDWVKKSDVWAADRTPQVIDDLVEVAGGTQFTGVYLYTNNVSAVAPTAPGATTTDRFSWRDGRAERDSAEGTLDADELFDVTTVDWTAVERLVAQASELSGIDDRPSSVYVERAVDGGASAAAKLSLHMSDDYGRSAHITTDAQGQIVWMDGDIEGSPAYEWETGGLYQPERARQAIDDLVAVAGTTQFVTVDINGWYVSADALAADGSTTVDLYWREGFASAESSSSEADPAALFDVTTVDWTLVEGLVAQARDLTGIDDPQPRVSVHGPRWQDDTPGLVFGIYPGDSDFSTYGTVVFDMAGQVVSMSGGAPGSASQEWEATH